MKKIIVILIVAFLVLLAATPLISGYCFKKQYVGLIENLNQNTPNIKISIENYRSHWLSSDAQLRVTYYKDSDKQDILVITQHITHGPLIFSDKTVKTGLASIKSSVHLTEDKEKLLPALKNGVVQLNTLADFSGRYITQINIPEINISNIVRINWKGLKGTVTITQHHNQIEIVQAEINFSPLFAELNAGNNLTIDPIAIKSEYHSSSSQLWTGNDETTIPGIRVNKSNQLFLQLKNLKMNEKMFIAQGTLYNTEHQLTLNSLEIPSFIIPSISALNVNLAFRNINTTELSKLISTINQSKHATDEDKKMLVQKMQTMTPTVITLSTRIDSNGKMNTSFGPVSYDATVFWPEKTALPQKPEDIAKHSVVKADLRIAIPLIQRFIAYSKEKMIGISTKPVAVETPPVTQMPANINSPFNDKIAQMVQQARLDPAFAIQIMDMHDKKMSNDEFAKNLQTMKLPADVETQLKQIYISMPAVTIPAQPTTPIVKTVLEDWIDQGYLVPDKTDYVMSLIGTEGTYKINGKIIQ